MPWLIALVAIFVVLVIAQVIIAFRVAQMLEHSPPFNVDEPASDLNAEEVRFRTADGLTLHGRLFSAPELERRFTTDGDSKGLILFCHELGSNCWSALEYCEGLLNAGFQVLAFDFRNHGQSESHQKYEPVHWLSQHEINDMKAALAFVAGNEQLNQLPLGVFGISRGGSAALATVAEHRQIQFVAVEGAYSSHQLMTLYSKRWVSLFAPGGRGDLFPEWHVEITLSLARRIIERRRNFRFVKLERNLRKLVDRNVMLIAGQRDSYARPEIGKEIYSELESDQSEFWMVAEARHNGARHVDPQRYDEKLVRFFERLSTHDPIPTDIASAQD